MNTEKIILKWFVIVLLIMALITPISVSATWNNTTEGDSISSIVNNGSFESPDVTSTTFDTYLAGRSFGEWTVESGSVDHISERYWQAGDGRQSLDLNGYSAGIIYQDLLTTPLQTYSLQFSVAGNPEGAPSNKQIEVWWGSEKVDTITFDTTGHSNWQMGWFYHQYPVTATNAITRIKFKSMTSGCYGPVLDAIIVKPLASGVPSLDLPFDYTNQKFSNVAIGITGVNEGRVTSWFDHTLPKYGDSNGIVTLWTGIPRLDLSDTCTFGFNCYDGHNGIDFQRDNKLALSDTPVYAAASGTVREVNRDWKNNVCGNRGGSEICGYGNFVLIDHGGGYATLYAHLDRVDGAVQLNQPIGRQIIGYMGGTGGWATHLHFGVYYDPNGIWPEKTSVDPYGWFGNTPDPWSMTSFYLWKYPLYDRATAYTNGAVLTSPSGTGKLIVSPGMFATPINLELWDSVLPFSLQSNQLIVGHPLWVRVFSATEQLPLHNFLVYQEKTLPGPVTINIRYKNADLSHVDLNQLNIYHLDETTNQWVALPTSIDNTLQEAVSQTNEEGYFSLQAPQLCNSFTEPNDINDESFFLQINHTPHTETFDSASDEDWFVFYAFAGRKYHIQSSNWTEGSQSSLELYEIDGGTLITKSTDILQINGNSIIDWQATESGIYFIHAIRPPSGAYGCNATYDLSISQALRIYLPFIYR